MCLYNVQGNIAGLVDSSNSIVIEYEHGQSVICGVIGHMFKRRVDVQLGGALSSNFVDYDWRENQLVYVSDGASDAERSFVPTLFLRDPNAFNPIGLIRKAICNTLFSIRIICGGR